MARLSHLLREFPGILIPVGLVLGIAALVLSLLNSVPAQLQGSDRILEFKNIREAQMELGISISVPAYFPDYLSWPPAFVQAQRKPALTVLLLFLSREKDREALWISQVIAEEDKESLTQLPEPKKVLQRSKVDVGENEGELILGRDTDGKPYNYVRWRHGNRHLAIATIYAPEELLKMARSMTY